MFKRLYQQYPEPRPPHWRCNRQKGQVIDDLELPTATVNTTGKGKSWHSDSSNTEYTLGFRWTPVKNGGIHQCTHLQTGAAILFDYAHFSPIYDNKDEVCSAVATSQTSSSVYGKHTKMHMPYGSSDIVRKVKEK